MVPRASTSPALVKPSHPPLHRSTNVHCTVAQTPRKSDNTKMLPMPSSDDRLALMRVLDGSSDGFRGLLLRASLGCGT